MGENVKKNYSTVYKQISYLLTLNQYIDQLSSDYQQSITHCQVPLDYLYLPSVDFYLLNYRQSVYMVSVSIGVVSDKYWRTISCQPTHISTNYHVSMDRRLRYLVCTVFERLPKNQGELHRQCFPSQISKEDFNTLSCQKFKMIFPFQWSICYKGYSLTQLCLRETLAVTQLNVFREKPKIIKASQKKSSRTDGEPEAKRRKVDVNETTIVQRVTLCLFQ